MVLWFHAVRSGRGVSRVFSPQLIFKSRTKAAFAEAPPMKRNGSNGFSATSPRN